MIRILLIIISLLVTDSARANLAIPGTELFKAPDIFSVKLSPSTKFFATHLHNEDNYLLKITNIKTNKSHNLSFLKAANAYLRSYQWIDDETIYIKYAQDGSNDYEAFAHISFDGKKFTVKLNLFDVEGYIVQSLGVKNSEKNILYAKKERKNGASHTLYAVSTEDLESNSLDKSSAYPYQLKDSLLYFDFGDSLVGVKAKKKELYFSYLDKSLGKWTRFLTYEDKDYDFKPIGFINRDTLAVLSNYKSDLTALYEYDIQKQEFGKIIYQHDKYDLTNAKMDSKSKRVELVQYYDHGQLISHYLMKEDSVLNAKLQRAFPGKQVVVVSEKNNSKLKIIGVFASDDPGKYYLYDADQSKAELLGVAYKNLQKYKLAKSSVASIKTDDDFEIETIFTKPKTASNGVLLVMPHGGPIGVRNKDAFDREVQYLVSRGYSVLKVNFRGSSGFGKKFQKAGVGQFGKIIEKDITTAVKALKKKHSFSKTCSMGASYGGYSSVMLALKSPQEYDCVVARYGIYDLPLLFNSTNLDREEKRRKAIVNVVGEMNEDLYRVSPFYILEDFKTPILITGGKKDETAHFEQTNRMKYRLKQLGADVETIFYNDAGHGHKNWFGDRNELAFISNFLERKLALNLNRIKNISDIRREEQLIIADSYDNNDYLTPSAEKAYKHYSNAAKLGDPRAQFNVGSYYHRGEVVDYSLSAAKSWYTKASKNNYAKASYRLGEMYFGELLGQPNHQKSYKMFSTAKKQGHKAAYLELAKMQCLGAGIKKDVAKCIDVLRLDKDKNRYIEYSVVRGKRNAILKELAFENNFTEDEMESFKEIFTELFKTKEFSPRIEIESEGIFKKSKHDQTTNIVPLEKDVRFGVELALRPNSSDVSRGDHTALLVKWTPINFTDKNGSSRKPQLDLVFSGLKYERKYIYTLNQEWEMKHEGGFKLEIFTLEHKKLYEKTFFTKKNS